MAALLSVKVSAYVQSYYFLVHMKITVAPLTDYHMNVHCTQSVLCALIFVSTAIVGIYSFVFHLVRSLKPLCLLRGL